MEVEKFYLEEVDTPQLVEAFHSFPKLIYQANKQWVEPLRNQVEDIFDPRRNDMFDNGEAIRYIARDAEGNAVGRIAAFYNSDVSRKCEQPTGGCGFFECIDNQAVANLLFDAAKDWLSLRGMEAMDGPINFGTRDSWWGLLVEGFEHQPIFANNYNPPYYKRLLEEYGFRNYFNQNTYVWNINDDQVHKSVYERSQRVTEAQGYKFRNIKGRKLDDVAEELRIIYNKAWAMFSGVKPMDKAEAKHLTDTLGPIIDPEIVYFAYLHDEPIGFFVMIPDLNCIVGKFEGRFGLMQKARLMWDLKVAHSCDRITGIIFGITPEAQGKGVESGFMCAMLDNYVRTRRCRYRSIEFSWIGDFNPVMNRMMRNYICATQHKMHTTYRFLFDPTREFHRCPTLSLNRNK